MNTSSENLLTAAIGVLEFPAYEVAQSLLIQPGYPTEGFVGPDIAMPFVEAVWGAGLLAIATTAATALGGGATGANVLVQWLAGNVSKEISYGDVSGTTSGVAIFTALFNAANG